MKRNKKAIALLAPARVEKTHRYRVKANIGKGMAVKDWEEIVNAVDLPAAVEKFIELKFFQRGRLSAPLAPAR